MNLPKDTLRQLIETKDRPRISIFMPTHRIAGRIPEDPIRFRNLIAKAERQLVESGFRGPEAENVLRPARKLLDDPLFWQYQGEGLAVLISPSVFEYFTLPINPGELLIMGAPFHLKPLLHVLNNGGRFYVLALSQDEVRLLMGTRYDITDVELESIPEGLAETLNYDSVQKQLQWHTRAPGRGGRRMAVFHGHGVPPLDHKDSLASYFRRIDAGLREVLKEEKAPLVLAGVDYLLPIYRGVNSYANLLDRGVTGSPEELNAEQLHQMAWSVAEPHIRKAEREALLRYGDRLPRGLSSKEVPEIVAATATGRVDSLFTAAGLSIWGVLDEQNRVAGLHREQQQGDTDLSDWAAVQTLLTNGALYILDPNDMPDGASLAAIFRY